MSRQGHLYRKIHDYMTYLVTTDLFLPDLMHSALLRADHVRYHHVH